MSRAGAPRLLEGAALMLGLLGLAVWFWPVTPRVTPRAVRPPAPLVLGAAADGALADSVPARIIAGNLFSASRRAPRERFVAPGMATSSMPESLPSIPFGEGGDDAMGPQLFGIVRVDGTSRALIQIDADSAPRLVAEGARVGGWRVRRITVDRVELSSSSGTRVVRLSRRSLPDSAEPLP